MMIACPMHEGGFDCTPFCELCAGEQEIAKPKDYTLNAYADGFGVWHCEIFFAYPGLGNTGEAERVANNALRAAKRLIRAEIADRMAGKPKRLAYEVKANQSQLGSGRLLSLTIAEK
jgi:hypothetical protein